MDCFSIFRERVNFSIFATNALLPLQRCGVTHTHTHTPKKILRQCETKEQ